MLLYIKIIEVLERIFYKVCLTICIAWNDNLPYFKFVSKFYDLMTLDHLHESIIHTESEMYKKFGDERLKERTENIAIV